MAQTNLVGKTILGYSVTEKIGFGAFATVYKAVKTNASGQYIRALKHITIPTERQYNSVLDSMGGDISKADSYFESMLNNIVSEIQILNELSEKGIQNIVRYYENDIVTIESPKRYNIYILMEYLTPLNDYIHTKTFTVRDILRIGFDILNGVASCHKIGIIHRDIKDENIFYSNNGEYKLGDFGVSKVLKDSSKAESLKGTPNFIAPEVYLGKESYSKSVDLYSLGIVLYRLLNYNRNPFLPQYPNQYFDEDEINAFDERLSGKIPPKPMLGGEKIGEVIVKSISSSSERFQNAEEFIKALEDAVDSTSTDIIDQAVMPNRANDSTIEADNNQVYEKTMGETFELFDTVREEEKEITVNKNLFNTYKEPDIPKCEDKNTETFEKKHSEKFAKDSYIEKYLSHENRREVKRLQLAKSKRKYWVLISAIIFLVGILSFFIIVPIVYGKIISLSDWLFSGPDSIIDTLRNHTKVLPHVYSIIGLKIYWWILITSFIISLFLLGRTIQNLNTSKDTKSKLIRKSHLSVQEILDTLKVKKKNLNNKQLDSAYYSVKKLEELLSTENDFGDEDEEVRECEKDISQNIDELNKLVLDINKDNVDNKSYKITETVIKINSLLRKRTMLKRK